MAAPSLPTNPSLEHMRKQARDLQRAVRAGDATAVDRVTVHPGGRSNETANFPLSAAQLVVARSYGFPSWPRLVHYFDVVATYGRPGGATRDGAGNPDSGAPGDVDIADRFCRLACIDYSDDRPDYPAAARAILDARRDLTRNHIWAAAAANDVAAVRALLDRNPSLAGRTALVAALLAGDRARVDRIRTDEPGLLDQLLAAEPGLVMRATNVERADAVPLLVELGFDIDAWVDGATPLHWTAWTGDIATARMLLDLGADPTLRDDRFDATPQGWAEHARQDAYVAFIARHSLSDDRSGRDGAGDR